jgi:Tol biopolymer transport system component
MSDIVDSKKPLMKSTFRNGAWGKSVPMEIENFYNRNSYIDLFVAAKSKVLILAIERKDSKGEQDLYVSFASGENKWSEPINMGSVINSDQADFAPFLSADGKTLFFSSYKDGGLGGCDIYFTTRLDDTWTKWTAPKNLGAGINSSREEANFSISGNYEFIYFESYDTEHEVRDIFRAELPKEIRSELVAPN